MAASTRSIHSRQRAAGGRSKSSTSRASSPSRRRRRAAALIGRTAGRRAGPEARGRRQAPRGGRTGGARRDRSSARSGRLRPGERNPGRATGRRFLRPVWRGVLGATAMRMSARRERSAARSRAAAAARRSPRPRCSAKLGRRALAALPHPTASSGPEFSRDQRQGPGPAKPHREDGIERPEGEDFGFGSRGVREGGRTPGGRLRGRGDRVPCPARPPQAGREARRGHGQSSEGRGGGNPAGVEAGRAAREVTPELKQLGGRPRPASPSEAQIAQRRPSALRRRILAEAAALGAPGASAALRRRAGHDADARRGARGWRRPRTGAPLPCPSVRPRPGWNRRRRRKGPRFWGFRRSRSRSGRADARHGNGLAEVGEGVGNEGELGANHLAMMNSLAALCHVVWRGIRPACRGVGMSDNLTLSDMIRKPAQTPCQTPQNQALSPSWPAQRPLRRRALSLARRRKTRRDGCRRAEIVGFKASGGRTDA